MRKFILGLLQIFLSSASYSQEENNFSIGLGVDYLYPYISKTAHNKFNHGFSFLLSKNIAKIIVCSGINYSTLNYYFILGPSYLNRKEYKVKYLNFPLLVFINFNSQKALNINPFVGFIANKTIYYNSVTYNLNKMPVNDNSTLIPKNLGLTFRVGLNFSKSITKQIFLNGGPFLDLKFIQNVNDYTSSYYDIPDSRAAIGLKLGVEYNL